MVVPFLITLTGSMGNAFDYDRYAAFPRALYSRNDRFVKSLVPYFGYRNYMDQMRAFFPEMPVYWNSWSLAGRDRDGVNAFAKRYFNQWEGREKCVARMSADYAEFIKTYNLNDMLVSGTHIDAVMFLMQDYMRIYREKHPDEDLSGKELRKAALMEFNRDWGTPFESFYNVTFSMEMNDPMDFQTWFPPLGDARYRAFLRYKQYQARKIKPASLATPFAMRSVWYRFLQTEYVTLKYGKPFTLEEYNRLAGTAYVSLYQTPFPIPEQFSVPIRALWKEFQQGYYPLRLTELKVTQDREKEFQNFVKTALKEITLANRLLGTDYRDWNEITLAPLPPLGKQESNMLDLWKNFAKNLPADFRIYHSSEKSYQDFMRRKYGTLAGVNQAYGMNYQYWEEIFPPFFAAYIETFKKNQFSMSFGPVLQNYKMVGDYLLFNGNALLVTIALIALTILFTLTVNPIAAYALSRFNLRGHDKIILFMLATMAFPAMVSAIPAYLLMRDLGLLNTLWALVIPGAANGMSIFILKGFFDSLPQELFEAATIDGATEFQIFRIVAMPLVKPILAINCLTAFMHAYNGWEWAIIICQDKEMWTIAVWLYQASQWWGTSPWLVSAGFILASIPTLIVFLSCQKIILRGIVIPTMK